MSYGPNAVCFVAFSPTNKRLLVNYFKKQHAIAKNEKILNTVSRVSLHSSVQILNVLCKVSLQDISINVWIS